jgi:UDP-glucose-4-epimerase GalE
VSILVTGGAGYIGGFVTRELRRQDRDVVVVDDLSSGTPAAVGDAELVRLDVGDQGALRALMRDRGVDAVIHLAALKSVADSWREPMRYLEVNVGKTVSLLAAMADAGVDMLIYSSSCSIYGDATELPVDEAAPAAPLNPYARSKWLAEQAMGLAGSSRGLRHVALRYFNAAGAEPDGRIGEPLEGAVNLVPMVMKAALGIERAVTVHGTDYPTPDGTAIRDYVHVVDLADAHLRALDYLRAGGASVALNLGTGVGTSVRELIQATERASGRSIPVAAGPRRAGDPVALWAANERAGATLGWVPRHGIDDIVTSAWAWHSGASSAQ